MKTKKQEELVNSYLSQFENEIKPLYQDIILFLSKLGYNPKKEKQSISFKHDLHNKQIAKMGINVNKKKGVSPFFSLRFSACRGYSQRFVDIVSAYILKYPTRIAGCLDNKCNYCKGESDTHVYTYTFSAGEQKSHCGAYAVVIPNITNDDMNEIKKLVMEEQEYLMKHEASA